MYTTQLNLVSLHYDKVHLDNLDLNVRDLLYEVNSLNNLFVIVLIWLTVTVISLVLMMNIQDLLNNDQDTINKNTKLESKEPSRRDYINISFERINAEGNNLTFIYDTNEFHSTKLISLMKFNSNTN